MKSTRLYLAILLIAAALFSCAAPTQQLKGAKSTMPLEEQEAKSLERYGEILEMTAEGSMPTVAPKLIEPYKKLIADYPDSYYAEESYFRLMNIAIRYNWPPDFDTAEKYYTEYSGRYEKPRVLGMMNDFMVRNYYYYEQWDRLVTFLTPYIKKYVETRDPRPLNFMFYYAEAKFHLKDYEQAQRGYETLVEVSPDSIEGKLSKEKLKEIEQISREGNK